MSNVVYLKTSTPILPSGYTHTGTDWQLATDVDFNNVIFAVYNDTEDLLEKTVVVNVPGPYYARAAFRYGSRISEWSTVDAQSTCGV